MLAASSTLVSEAWASRRPAKAALCRSCRAPLATANGSECGDQAPRRVATFRVAWSPHSLPLAVASGPLHAHAAESRVEEAANTNERQHSALNLLVHEPLSALPRQPTNQHMKAPMDTLPCRIASQRSQEADMNHNYTAISLQPNADIDMDMILYSARCRSYRARAATCYHLMPRHAVQGRVRRRASSFALDGATNDMCIHI